MSDTSRRPPADETNCCIDVESPLINDVLTIGEQHGGIWVAETYDNWPELRFPGVIKDGMYLLVMATADHLAIGWRKHHKEMWTHHGASLNELADHVATGMKEKGLDGETILLILATIEEYSDEK